MNTKRFFLLLLLVFAATALLASCELLPPGLFPGSTTTEETQVTTSEATTMTTTESAATTAPMTTARPTAEAQGGIRRVTELASGAIRLTYGNNSTQSLGVLKAREGYNSAKATVLSLADGVLTLSLQDAAGESVANRFLDLAPSAVTVRLRERDGYLEWASATAEDWQVLCAARLGLKDELPLPRLAEAAEIAKAPPVTGNGVVLVVNGKDLRFRATDWLNEGYDMCSDVELSRDGRNPIFMMKAMYEVPSSLDKGFLGTTAAEGAVYFKDTGDEVPPITFNGTAIGGQHGYSLIVKIPNVGKTAEDIGSVWENANGQKYCLVKVNPGDGLLWLCPFDDEAMKDGNFAKYSKTRYAFVAEGDRLTHVSGATNTAAITAAKDAITDANNTQFYVSTLHVEQHVFLNGATEIPLGENAIYEAEFIDVCETYEIAYLPAVLNYLMENAGDNDNETCHSDKITEAYVRFTHTHRYHRNGSYTVYQKNEVLKKIYNVDYFGVMSTALARESYVYAPASATLSTVQKQPATVLEIYGQPTLVRDYYQFSDAVGSRGMAIGFYPFHGVATDENRVTAANPSNAASANVGWFSAALKSYPNLFQKSVMNPGESIEFIGYHCPTVPIDDDFFAIHWYFVGDEVMLLLNTDKAVSEKTVALPEYLNGLTVTITQKSDAFTVTSDTIDGGVTVSTTGAGYAILRLTPED